MCSVIDLWLVNFRENNGLLLRTFAKHRLTNNCDFLTKFAFETITSPSFGIELGLLPQQKRRIIDHYAGNIFVFILIKLGGHEAASVKFLDP